MKKVSIVVPVYKSEAFLPKLIDSVLGQSYTNLELILVDDESPDNSGKSVMIMRRRIRES